MLKKIAPEKLPLKKLQEIMFSIRIIYYVVIMEPCYGAMDRPDTVVNIVVNIIWMIIIL